MFTTKGHLLIDVFTLPPARSLGLSFMSVCSFPDLGRLEHITLIFMSPSIEAVREDCGKKISCTYSAQPLEYELVLLFCKEGEIELIVKPWEKYSIVFVTIAFFVYTKLNDLYI